MESKKNWGGKRQGAGRPNKHDRGLCCWYGCQEKATVTVRTPGENIRDNEEFIVCPRHWNMLLVAIKRLEDMGIIEPVLPVEPK
jgi:hypothetical protein